MKRAMIPLTIAFLALAAVPAAANLATFRLSFNIPTMKSDFWTTEFNQMTILKTGFQATSFGIGYEIFLTREFSLVFGLDTFSKSKSGMYRGLVGYTFAEGDFAFPDAYAGQYQPSHTLHYSVTPLQASVKLTPFGRRTKLIPYIGGGVGLYFYNLRMTGDLIDFSDEYIFTDSAGTDVLVYPIYGVDAQESEFGRIAFGYQIFGGLMYPIGNRMTVDAMFQVNKASANLKAFQGFEPLDLGSYQISIGFNYWF
jgi:opacity protein-like surface antigen